MKNKKNARQKKSIDVFVLILSPATASALTWFFPLTFLQSLILFFGVPSLYLSLRDPRIVKRCFVFALVLSFVSSFACYLAEKNQAWWTHTDFPWRLGGMISIEGVVWFFLLTYLIVAYYEFFYDHVKHKTMSRKMEYLAIVTLIAAAIFGLSWLMLNRIFTVDYFYLKFGIFFGVLPLLAFIFEFPRFLSLMLKMAPYFISLHFLNEIVSLHKGYWAFPGQQFVGWVNLGSYRFPIEELIFWIILFSSITIAYFEIFDDNRLKFKNPFQARLHKSSK